MTRTAENHPPASPIEARTVGVLEWVKPHGAETLRRAETPIGVYRAYTHHEARGRWFWSLDGYQKTSGDAADEAAAKAAAQADYEARIRSALVEGCAQSAHPCATAPSEPVNAEMLAALVWVIALPSGKIMHETPTFSSREKAVEWGKGFWGKDEWNNGYQVIPAAHIALLESQVKEAREVIGEGLDLVSGERGWGTYRRMDSVEIYEEADAFRDRARTFLASFSTRLSRTAAPLLRIAAMAKLNERQRAALLDISTTPGKSGRFYAKGGHLPVTLSSLHYRRLIATERDNIIGRSIFGATWTLTEAGRAALEGREDG